MEVASLSKDNRKVIIDRFEGDWAVIEYNRKTFDFPVALLPTGLKEGDVLIFNVEKDTSETQARKERIENLAKQLFKEE